MSIRSSLGAAAHALQFHCIRNMFCLGVQVELRITGLDGGALPSRRYGESEPVCTWGTIDHTA